MASDDFFREAAISFLTMTWQGRRRPLQKDVSSLNAGETGMLLFLSESPRSVTAGEIGRGLRIGSGGVANLLNSLEKKGYIVRSMSPTDRRSVEVTLSPAGNALIEEKKRETLCATTAFLKALGEEDTREMLRIYRRVLDITEEWMRRQETNGKETGKDD